MTAEFWAEVDLVDLSLYPETDVRFLESPQPSPQPKLRVTSFDSFTETFSTTRIQDPQTVQKIWERCGIKNFCYGIVNGSFFKCMRAPYLNKLLRLPDGDGLALRTATLETLEAYLRCDSPLGACWHCTGTDGKRFRHTQPRSREWMQLQERPISEMLSSRFT
jgi:hypothetical protein